MSGLFFEDPQDHQLAHVNKRALRSFRKSVQAAVIDSLASGMKAWFGFYFKTGDGNFQERLSTATTALREASDRLHQLADALSDADHSGHAEANSLKPYRDAVDNWGMGLSMIAEGIELDNQSAARRGLSLLVEASAKAELVVRGPLYPNLVSYRNGAKRVFPVDEALRYLLAVSPPRGVPKTAVRHAKQPWEQAIIAAGSPFRRL